MLLRSAMQPARECGCAAAARLAACHTQSHKGCCCPGGSVLRALCCQCWVSPAAAAVAAITEAMQQPLPHLPNSARQINSRISNAARPERVLALVQQNAAEMDSIYIATAYSRLGSMCKADAASARAPAVHEALRLLQQQLACFRARELANIIHACHYLAAKTQCSSCCQCSCSHLCLPQLWHRGWTTCCGLLPSLALCCKTARCSSCFSACVRNRKILRRKSLPTACMQLPERQLQQLLTVLCSKLESAKPQACSNTLWAVAKMGQQVPPEQLQQLLDVFTLQLHTATPQGVANILWACSEFRVLPSQLLTALEQQPRQLERLLSVANAQEPANMALACAWLGFGRAYLLDAVLQQAVQLLQHQTSSAADLQHRANLCWSVAVLDLQQHAASVLQLAGACSKQSCDMIPQEQQQLYQAHLWLQDCQLPAGSSHGLGSVLTQQQLEQCRASWEQALLAGDTSQLQRSVFAALQCLPDATWQQQPALEQPTADKTAVIDIVAATQRGVKLAIEVDGPWHFVQPGNQLNGPTQHRNRVLAARGYSVVCIPYWEWDGLSRRQQQVEYLQHKLADYL